VQTRSALLTGLLGLAELVPLVAMALLGGALADRMDRRRLLLLDQIALVAVAVALCAAALSGDPPVLVLYVLGGLACVAGAVVVAAAFPALVAYDKRAALAEG